MADVQSFYQSKQSAKLVFDADFFPFSGSGGVRTWYDKYGGSVPSSLLHINLQGLVANDLSYIRNRAIPPFDGPLRGIILFRFDNIPAAGIASVKLKFRWYVEETPLTISDFLIVVYQGRPNNIQHRSSMEGISYWVNGSRAEPTTFTKLASWSEVAAVNNTWFDSELVIDPALITDPDDLWVAIEADSDFEEDDDEGEPVIRISWLVLEITYAFGRAEIPIDKNYVGDIVGKLNISIRTVGTPGTSKYCYRVVACDSDGVCGPISAEVVIETGNATLDATNHICLSWLDNVDATNYKIYRTCSPSLGLGLLATVIPDAGDCGGGGGGGETGYKDDGSDCITDCDELFNPEDFEGCEDETTVTIGAKETPTVVTFPSKEVPV